ncbi:MAG: porin [Burkholderiaceae bacterium]|nr:porin [Burkholderiaceae bacterium]
MKKTLLAACALATMAGGAMAQSNVTIYGIADVGIVSEHGNKAGTITKVTSGIGSGSRLGFKGEENLGDGLSAYFTLESGIGIDTGTNNQGGIAFGRQTFVGLKGDFGSLSLGREYTPYYKVNLASDPFGGGFGGNATNLLPYSANAGRLANNIHYSSPKFSGFRAEVAYGAGEVAGDNNAGSQVSVAVWYEDGPLTLAAGHHNTNNDTSASTNLQSAKNSFFTAIYDFSVVKAYIGYGIDKGLNSSPLRNTTNPYGSAVAPVASTDSTDLVFAASAPFGPHTLIASYVVKNDKTIRNQDADQYSIGYLYAFSKRTDFYSNWAKINNKRGAGYTVGSVIESGSGDSAFQIGIRHRF